jgi:hypothetical protein
MISTILRLDGSSARGFASAVSMHAHTLHSREYLSFLPGMIAKVPIVSRVFELEMSRYLAYHGRTLDFGRTYWRPPLSPLQVLNSECAHVAPRLSLDAMVSITDHDTIAGCLELRAADARASVPLSFEWTVSFRGACFHFGVHNLPSEWAEGIVRECAAITAQPDERKLADLLAWLNAMPGTLVVLNHPFWDGNGVGDQQVPILHALLERFGRLVHALELNGYRSWAENVDVIRLHERCRMPLVAGGDRHGRTPNALLNLSQATSFEGFAHEVRVEQVTHVLVLPEYFESRVGRTLEAVAEVLGTDARLEARERWTDRVFVETDEHGDQPVSRFWTPREPAWVKFCVGTMCLAGSPGLRVARRLALTTEQGVQP